MQVRDLITQHHKESLDLIFPILISVPKINCKEEDDFKYRLH